MEIKQFRQKIRPDQITRDDWEGIYTVMELKEGQKTLTGNKTYNEIILMDEYGMLFTIWDWDIFSRQQINLKPNCKIKLCKVPSVTTRLKIEILN